MSTSDYLESLIPQSRSRQEPPVLIRSRKRIYSLGTRRLAKNLYVVGDDILSWHTTGKITVMHVDGIGILDASPVSRPADLSATFMDDPHGAMARVRGDLAVYLYDARSESVLILPDPLGGALVYVYHSNDIQVTSTSLTALVRAVKHLVLKLTKSAMWFSELLITESGGFSAGSSYDEISTIRPFSYLTLSRKGVTERAYPSAQGFFSERPHYDDSLDLIENQMRESAVGFSELSGARTAHLSAGADSRLSVASLVSAGVSDRFSYYCASNAVTREGDIAHGVASELGLRMTDDSGMAALATPSTPFDQVIAMLVANQGMKLTGPSGSAIHRDGVVLTGLYGELMRSFYSGRLPMDWTPRRIDFAAVLCGPIIADPDSGVLRPEVLDRLIEAIDTKIGNAVQLGIRDDAIGDYLYATVRNRYFAAHTQMESSRYVHQSSTLYSPEGFRLALSLPLEARADGKIIYDLFKRLAPAALNVPFDSEKFGPSVRGQEGYRTVEATSYAEPETDGRAAIPPFEKYSLGLVKPQKVDSTHVQQARKIGGLKAWQVAYETPARQLIKQGINQGNRVLEESFDMDRLSRIINQPASVRSNIRFVNRLAALMQWYSD